MTGTTDTGAPTTRLTPLVELVDQAARAGWSVSTTEDGELEWTRGANQIVAKFAASTQRPRYAGLINYTDYEQTGRAQVGTVVWRGVGNGGDSTQAHQSLRKWFSQRVRTLTDPTQW